MDRTELRENVGFKKIELGKAKALTTFMRNNILNILNYD